MLWPSHVCDDDDDYDDYRYDMQNIKQQQNTHTHTHVQSFSSAILQVSRIGPLSFSRCEADPTCPQTMRTTSYISEVIYRG